MPSGSREKQIQRTEGGTCTVYQLHSGSRGGCHGTRRVCWQCHAENPLPLGPHVITSSFMPSAGTSYGQGHFQHFYLFSLPLFHKRVSWFGCKWLENVTVGLRSGRMKWHEWEHHARACRSAWGWSHFHPSHFMWRSSPMLARYVQVVNHGQSHSIIMAWNINLLLSSCSCVCWGDGGIVVV